MERPVKEHIYFLERRVQRLNRLIMENERTQEERNRLESEIRATQLALDHYCKALELEKQIRRSA
jgi:uncharacterized protein YlxW (UPF0749 family)